MLINLTPHTLNIQNKDNKTIDIEPSGKVMRVKAEYIPTNFQLDNNISVFKVNYGDIEITDLKGNKLKEEKLQAYFSSTHDYIVSGMVLEALKEYKEKNMRNPEIFDNFYKPGELVRDENGKIVACNGLIQM